MAANSIPTVNRPRLRRWLFSSAREAFHLAQSARRADNRPEARKWLSVSRGLRVAAYGCGGITLP